VLNGPPTGELVRMQAFSDEAVVTRHMDRWPVCPGHCKMFFCGLISRCTAESIFASASSATRTNWICKTKISRSWRTCFKIKLTRNGSRRRGNKLLFVPWLRGRLVGRGKRPIYWHGWLSWKMKRLQPSLKWYRRSIDWFRESLYCFRV
jgi:hypothetical protein